MKEVRDRIIEANAIEDALKYFTGQIAIVAIALGVIFKSWIVFGIACLLPIAIFVLSGKVKVCKILSLGLCGIYIVFWGYIGFVIGSIFSLSASIVLCLLFLIPGVACNWCMFNYFTGK